MYSRDSHHPAVIGEAIHFTFAFPLYLCTVDKPGKQFCFLGGYIVRNSTTTTGLALDIAKVRSEVCKANKIKTEGNGREKTEIGT